MTRTVVLAANLNVRIPSRLIAAVDAAALERRVTRSALIRGVLEDALDAGELPDAPDELDRELERLRELTTG